MDPAAYWKAPWVYAGDATAPAPAPGASGIEFTAGSHTIAEGGGAATVTCARPAWSAVGTPTVVYGVAAGTATPGVDLAAVGSVTFAPGEATKTFAVPVFQDDRHEGTEAATLVLLSTTGGALGGRTAAEPKILLDDAVVSYSPHVNGGWLYVGMGTESRDDAITLDRDGTNLTVGVNGEVTTFPLNVLFATSVSPTRYQNEQASFAPAAVRSVTVDAGKGRTRSASAGRRPACRYGCTPATATTRSRSGPPAGCSTRRTRSGTSRAS